MGLTQLTLRDYLAPVIKRRWLILALVVPITVIVSVYEVHRPTTYTATTRVFVGQTTPPATQATATSAASTPSATLINDQAALLTVSDAPAAVAKKLGYTGPPGALGAGVFASLEANGSFVDISATEGSSIFAARVANAFAQEFIARLISAEISTNNLQIAGLEKQLRLLRGARNAVQRTQVRIQIGQLQVANSLVSGSATQVNVAAPPPRTAPHTVEYGVIAAIASLLGSVLLAYMLERLDPRMKRIDEAPIIYTSPVLATVAHDSRIEYFSHGSPGLSPRSREAFRTLLVSLDLAASAGRFGSILVTSAAPGEGKSTVARNLAIAFAEAGRRAALIDADVRESALTKKLVSEPGLGLTDLLAGRASEGAVEREIELAQTAPASTDSKFNAATAARRESPTERTVITLVPAGSAVPNPSAVFASPGFRELLHRTSDHHDVVIIDSPPVTAASDAIPLMSSVDAIVLVVRSGTTDRRTGRRAADMISRIPDAHVVGVVVNDVSDVEAAAYGLGYGYAHTNGNGRSATAI